MKILAIRGCNLASLAGDFEVALADGPLSQVGLFAITGPTGAGKSTLLDALCLPLFNETPRLTNQGGVEIGAVGEKGLKDRDPRSLLRRGAASGFAEVDFLGNDGRRYRARWSVRRARMKVDGAVQGEEITLTDLTSKVNLSGTKSETLDQISRRLGLSFAQFKQSVLLAQGGFAAFLQADGTERAQLLERMTNSEIYGKLSTRAWEKAQEAENAIAAHKAAHAGFTPMAEDARAALEESREALRQSGIEKENLIKQIEAEQRWYVELASKAEKARVAEAEHKTAAEAWDGARTRREELEAVRLAQPLRAEVEATDTAARQVSDAKAELELRKMAFEAAQVTETDALGIRTELTTLHTAAQDAVTAAAPEIDRARQLDTEVQLAAEVEAKKRGTALGLADEAARLEQQATALTDELSRSEDRVKQAQKWLDDRAFLTPLAREWSRWQQELARFGLAHAQWMRDEASRPDLDEAVERALNALDDAKATADQRKLELAQVSDAMEEKQKAAAAFDVDGLIRDRAAVTAHRERLAALEAVRAKGARAYADAEENRHTEATATNEVAKAEAVAARVAEERPGLAARFEEARGAVERLAAARSLDDHRGTLKAGEECPLCGSKEHPWAHGSALDDWAAREQERVRELARQMSELDGSLAAAESQAKRARADALAAATRAGQNEAELVKLQRAWADDVRALDESWPQALTRAECLPGDLRELAAESRLVQLQAAAKSALDRGDAVQKRAQEAEKAFKLAMKAYQEAIDAEKAANQQVREAETAAVRAIRELESLVQRIAASQTKRADAIHALTDAFPDQTRWRSELESDPEEFATRCKSLVAAYEARVQARDEAKLQIDEYSPKRAAAVASANAKCTESSKAALEVAEAARELQAKRDARSVLLNGQPTADFERNLQHRLTEAAKAKEDAAGKHEIASNAAAAARASLAHAQATLEAAEEQACKASERLASVLAGSDLASLRARLARDNLWISAEEKALEELSRRHTQAEQSLELLRNQYNEHTDRDQPARPENQCASDVDAARAQLAQLQSDQSVVVARLETDERNRAESAKAAEVLGQLEAKAQLWGALAQVIGSKDGNRFRRFAQSLTLDALLVLANEHLVQLAPRYRLMRVPNSRGDAKTLELQVVDTDMGDEIRSTNTLSGGETFLVSLALALGLSSLAAQNTKIDSLFIDEGFGTLDPMTLEVALSTLDALQAHGRQVGLISHVPGLGERIGAQVIVERRGTGSSTVRTRVDAVALPAVGVEQAV